MKKITNILSIVLVMAALAILVIGRIGKPVIQPTVTVYVTKEIEVTPAGQAEPEPVVSEEPEPEPQPEYFIFSFVGDCTLTSFNGGTDYRNKMGEDYAYTFRNTVSYFKDDELTFANLECSFSDRALYAGADRTFSFRCPTAYVNILLEGSVEFVNTANNHFDDFGQNGIDDTLATLREAGVAYGEKNSVQIYETKNGLKVGIYCEPYNNNIKNTDQIVKSTVEAVNKLKEMGAEYIICAYHWGNEGKYSVFDAMSKPAHAAIDAGANLVYGSHPHVLLPIEEYNGGVILYSLGNWSFGGNTHPSDPDTALVQVTVKRDLDGTVSTEGYKAVPCCVSSTFPPNFSNVKATDYNDYVPTPYEEGSDNWERTMSKLTGTYTGGDLIIDYSAFH